MRLQGVAPAEAGKLIGLIGLLIAPLGTIAGGITLDRLRARGVAGAPLVVMGVGVVYILTTVTAFVLSPNLTIATIAFSLFMFGSTFVLPALYVGMQMLTPDRYRGVAASFNMMVYTLCGLGLGPPAVGAISDMLGEAPTTLGTAVVIVEAVMAAFLVPVALLSRRAFQRRTLAADEAR